MPFKLRRKIYADAWAPELRIHLPTQDGRFEESPCIGANLGQELLEDRFPPGRSRRGLYQKAAVVLGAHYMCEEPQKGLVKKPDHPSNPKHDSVSMLFVCKQIHIGSAPALPGSPASMIRSPIFRQILSVSLCPFAAFNECLGLSFQDPGQSSEGGNGALPAEAAAKLRTWRQVWPSLAALPHLERLSVWLDHDGMTWSGIDERSLLRPLALATWRNRVSVTVRVPRLPGDKIRPGQPYHMDNAGEDLPFRIVRRLRRPDLAPIGENWMGVFPDVEDDDRDGDWGANADLNLLRGHHR